jgi:myo-inositol-1(or 4)-monophosphatase
MAKWREFLGAAREAALEAGRMLRSAMDQGREISYKGVVDLVTNFDRQAQDLIFGRLVEAFPGHGFLAEEGLSRGENEEFRWIFDPLDGTTNFAHRFPVFAVSIALVRQRQVILGVVYDPMRRSCSRPWRARGRSLTAGRSGFLPPTI